MTSMRRLALASIPTLIAVVGCGDEAVQDKNMPMEEETAFNNLIIRQRPKTLDGSLWATLSTGLQPSILHGDFNGDGKEDVLVADIPASIPEGTQSTTDAKVWVGISDGNRFQVTEWAEWETTPTTRVQIGDFNGDGRDDIVKIDVPAMGHSNRDVWIGLSTGSGFATSTWATMEMSRLMMFFVGDFDGDGLADVAKVDVPQSGSTVSNLWVGLSTGSRLNVTSWGSWMATKTMRVLTGDFNGDKKTDIAGLDFPAVGAKGKKTVFVGLSTSDRFMISSWESWSMDWRTRFAAGDFNGDGRTDIARFEGKPNETGEVNVMVAESNGTVFRSKKWGEQPITFHATLAVGDFDGDGRKDIAQFDLPSRQAKRASLWMSRSRERGFQIEPAGLVDATSTTRLVAGDFDGNGKDDLLWVHRPVEEGGSLRLLVYGQ